jgi:hypothetical protein
MPKQKRARGRPKKNWLEGIKKALNRRNLKEDKWEDKKQWSLGVQQRRKMFQNWRWWWWVMSYYLLVLSDIYHWGMILAVHWFCPWIYKINILTIVHHDLQGQMLSLSQNIPATVHLLVSASNISFLSLKELFQLRNYFWSHIVRLLIYYFG